MKRKRKERTFVHYDLHLVTGTTKKLPSTVHDENNVVEAMGVLHLVLDVVLRLVLDLHFSSQCL